jgi:hypothetical protein
MWLLFVSLSALADPAPFQRAACDVPAPALATADVADADACEATCAARADCGAWTFVSGWGQCRLHAPGSKHLAIQLWSAARGADGALPPPTADHDHRGKDLERAPRDRADAAACAADCAATATCTGYVYVQGYRSCWLKQTAGELVAKSFTCGWRAP